MKKFIITFFGIVFLLPAFAYAGSYCVKFPSDGNSKWSKRDNNIRVRFKYDYEITNEEGKLEGNATIGSNLVDVDRDYKYFNYGSSDYCIGTGALATKAQQSVDWHIYNAVTAKEDFLLPKSTHITYPRNSVATIKRIWLDVKYGGDCPKISGNLLTSGKHIVKIHRRRGDHINPFGCKWW